MCCTSVFLRAAGLLALLVAAAVTGGRVWAQEPVLEHEVKAAFIVKFSEYVNWPKGSAAPAGEPLRISAIGDSRIAAELRRIVSGRSVQGRPIVFAEPQGANPPEGVHILFIGRDASASLRRNMAALRQRAVLIVTDHPSGLEMGGIINFVTIDDHVRFEISLRAASDARLALSSRLLAVAIHVIKGGLDLRPDAILLAWVYGS